VAFSLDPSGKIEATSTVSADASADLDLDAVAVGDRVVVGWTNRRALDPRVETAVLDGVGKVVRAPERLTKPDGEQALLRLVPPLAGGTQAFVAWEKLGARPEGLRRIGLSRLSTDGHAEGAPAELEFASGAGGAPEFQAGPRGLLALTLAPVCLRTQNCADADVAPTYVELDDRMQLVAAEPLRLDALGGSPAELGFGMGCTKQGCFALAALTEAPAPVFATTLEARSNAWRPPLSPQRPSRRWSSSTRPWPWSSPWPRSLASHRPARTTSRTSPTSIRPRRGSDSLAPRPTAVSSRCARASPSSA
jgi:hypothetical protein